jgi:hypothetical protein
MSTRTSILILIIGGWLAWTWLSGEETEPNPVPTERAQLAPESRDHQPSLPAQEEPEKTTKSSTSSLTLHPPRLTSPTRAKYPNLDDSFAPFDAEGNRFVEQVVKVGKHLVYHGDVLLGDLEDLPRLTKNKVIKVGQSRKWPNGKIPYVIDDNVAQADMVLDAIEYLNTFTHLKITPREEEEDFVLLTRGEVDCYSYAGRIGGMQEIFLHPRCGVREILHEWMHTIGFLHEQNREDRDQFVEILWDNIAEVNHAQFKKLPNDYMRVVGRPFDYQSIMMYSSATFSQSPGEPSLLTVHGEYLPPSQNLLSDEDIARVNSAYPNP